MVLELNADGTKALARRQLVDNTAAKNAMGTVLFILGYFTIFLNTTYQLHKS